MATPTAELARVSSARMPATPAAKATPTVDASTVVRPPSASALRTKPEGIRFVRSSATATSVAVTHDVPSPTTSVTTARRTSRPRRLTRPTQAALIGSMSGLIAIAPTIRIVLTSITPNPAIDACRDREGEIERDRSGVAPRLSEHVGPDQARGWMRRAHRRDLVEACERDVVLRNPAAHQELQRRVS